MSKLSESKKKFMEATAVVKDAINKYYESKQVFEEERRNTINKIESLIKNNMNKFSYKLNTWAILTAFNPFGAELSKSENDARNAEMIKDFVKDKVNYVKVKGEFKDGEIHNIEDSFLLINVDKDYVAKMAGKYCQFSFIFAEVEKDDKGNFVKNNCYLYDVNEDEKYDKCKKECEANPMYVASDKEMVSYLTPDKELNITDTVKKREDELGYTSAKNRGREKSMTVPFKKWSESCETIRKAFIKTLGENKSFKLKDLEKFLSENNIKVSADKVINEWKKSKVI